MNRDGKLLNAIPKGLCEEVGSLLLCYRSVTNDSSQCVASICSRRDKCPRNCTPFLHSYFTGSLKAPRL